MKISSLQQHNCEKLKSHTATCDLNNVSEWGRIMGGESFTFVQLSAQKVRKCPSSIKCIDTCTLHSPWNNSGAAYGGLPQNVSNLLPGVNSLLNPKSAILIFISLSSSKFSACNTILKTCNATLKCMTRNMLDRLWLTNLKLWLCSRINQNEMQIYLQISMNNFLLMAVLYCRNNLEEKCYFSIT